MPGRGAVDAVLFWGDLVKNSEPKIIRCFYICWPGKGFWLGANGSYLFCLEAEGCPRISVKWGTSLKVVNWESCLSWWGTIKFTFCKSWCPSRICFESTFIYHGNGCSDRRCEGWFINGVVACRRSCFVWRIIKWGHGQVWEMDKCSGRRVWWWMLIKQKVCSYYLGRKVVLQKRILGVFVVSGLVVILFSLRNASDGITAVVLMCLGRSVYYNVAMFLPVKHALVIIVQ